MNKSIIIKASIMLGTFGLILGLAFGCSAIKDKNATPKLSNPDEVYLKVGDIEVTNQELWDVLKIQDGLGYLSQYVEEILYADEILSLTQDEIDSEIEYLTYQTNNQDIITEIKDNADVEERYIDSFNQALLVLGFDPDNQEDVEDFVKLSAAKRKAAVAYILNVEEGDDLEITDTMIQDYYEGITYGDSCALVVRFNSDDEVEAMFDNNNVVPNYNQGFGIYTGVTPIEELANSEFDEGNTTQLSDALVFTEFVKLYNKMNPNKTQINLATTKETFCENYSEIGVYNYEEMSLLRGSSDPYISLRDYMFDTLNQEEEGSTYSYVPQTFGEFEVLVFEVSQAGITAFADLTQTEKDALLDEILVSLVNDQVIAVVTDKLMEDHEFEIFDPVFKLQTRFNGGEVFENKGSETVIAKLDDFEITADILFEYMEETIGSYYALEVVKSEMVLNSEEYTTEYGDSHDYLRSNNDNMAAHREQLREYKTTFSSNGYAQFASSSEYTWEEFLVVAFGALSEENVIRDLMVVGALQPYLALDIIDFDAATPVMQEYVDNYFDLEATHLLVYLDNDQDFGPDEFNEYVEGLSALEKTIYDGLKASLEALIFDKIDEGDSFTEIVNAYNDGLIDDDDNEFKVYKEYGFFLLTQSLSGQTVDSQGQTQTTPNLTYAYSKNFDKDFVARLKEVYDDYVALKGASAEELTEYYDTQLSQSDFGLHLIFATEGPGFEMPSAVFTNDGSYSDGSSGTTIIPNNEQLAVFQEIKFAELTGQQTDKLLPSGVYAAIVAYYEDIFNANFTGNGYSIAVAQYILDNDPVFSKSQTEKVAYIESILTEFYNITFPEGYLVPTE